MQSSSDLTEKASAVRGTKGSGRPRRFCYAANFTIIIRCVEAPGSHPEWRDKEWVHYDDSVRIVGHNQGFWDEDREAMKSRTANSARRIAQMVQAKEGGIWIGRMRDCTNDPFPDRRLSAEDKQGVEQHILNGPDGPGKDWLIKKLKNNANKKKQGAEKLVAVSPVPAPIVTYRCNQGHEFTKPDGKRCSVGCCPQCHEVNRDYQPLSAAELAQATQAEDKERATVDRLRHPSPLSGPVYADDAFFKQRDDLPERPEPGATEMDENTVLESER
jgi:hypothetical protein